MLSSLNVIKIEEIPEQDRFDLEVEDTHCFFANGILVHNCRMVHTYEGAFSRKGKPFFTVPHVTEILRPFFERNVDLELDGELYNHELKRDFNKIISLVKKQKPTQADLYEAASMVQYHVYDLPSCPGGFEVRTAKLKELVEEINRGRTSDPIIVYVETKPFTSYEEMVIYFEDQMENGYEGGITRVAGHEYERKRTKHLLKWKSFVDDEFIIKNIEEGTGNWAGAAKGIWFEMPNGSPFKATMMGTRDYCREVFENRHKYIGCEATVKMSKDLTPAGIPRWGNVKVIHKNGKREI